MKVSLFKSTSTLKKQREELWENIILLETGSYKLQRNHFTKIVNKW